MLPSLLPSFKEEKKQTDWGPPCVTNKGWLSLGLLDPRSVHHIQVKCLTIMLKRKAKLSPYVESITWNPAHAPQCTNDGLREETAIPRGAGGTQHRATLSNSLGQRGFFTPIIMQKGGGALTRPKYQPCLSRSALTGSMIPCLPPSSNSFFPGQFLRQSLSHL